MRGQAAMIFGDRRALPCERFRRRVAQKGRGSPKLLRRDEWMADELKGKPVNVQCYAGYKADEEPRSFSFATGELKQVLGIADRWYDPAASYFKVRADDGHRYLLKHDFDSDSWTVEAVFRQDA